MSLRVWLCPPDTRRQVRLRLRLWSPKMDGQLEWLFGKYDLSCRSILSFWECSIALGAAPTCGGGDRELNAPPLDSLLGGPDGCEIGAPSFAMGVSQHFP